MATHFSILDWEVTWKQEPGGLQGPQELDMTEAMQHAHTTYL